MGRGDAQQFPMADQIADKLVLKYKTSTREQLWEEKSQQQGKPRPQLEQDAIQMLRNNAQMRAEFINRVAAPVVSKMFECGMIP
jgi:hypothetical protein